MGPNGSRDGDNLPLEGGGWLLSCNKIFTVMSDIILPDILGTDKILV